MRNAVADVFFVIAQLGQTSACPRLRAVCNGTIYVRQPQLVATPTGDLVSELGHIVKVMTGKRDRIVRVITDYIDSFDISADTRQLLTLLCQQYQYLAAQPHDSAFTTDTWQTHRSTIERARPGFYYPGIRSLSSI